MPTPPAVSLTPQVLARLLRRHARLWLAPAVAGLVLAAFMSLVTPRKWEATQGFLIRSEAAGFADQRLGKFTDLSEMKAVQETVLELARSRSVLSSALKQVGPKSSWFASRNWPSTEQVVDFRENVRVSPPGGAEFGTTEVFYLTVNASSPERARQLAGALADQLEQRLREVRDERAASLIDELQHSVAAARAARDTRSARLAAFEAEIGADLAELRALESPVGGQGELAQTALAIEAELRQNGVERRRNEQLLASLRASLQAPERLLATPSYLLASQPAVERLKSGLIDAQINAAALASSRSDKHPMVIAARNREAQVRAEMHKELPVAIAGAELELKLNDQRADALRAELAAARTRLAGLAGRRSEYTNLTASVANHNRLVKIAEEQLADAHSHQAGAKSGSVLARIDEVEAGLYPVGPGRTVTTAAGGLAGLVLGLGLLFSLHSPAEVQPGPSPPESAAGPFGAPTYAPAAGAVEAANAVRQSTTGRGGRAACRGCSKTPVGRA